MCVCVCFQVKKILVLRVCACACVCVRSLSFRADSIKSKMAVLVWFGFDQKVSPHTTKKINRKNSVKKCFDLETFHGCSNNFSQFF